MCHLLWLSKSLYIARIHCKGMTTVRKFDKKCAICTETSPQSIMTSTSTLGYPDLDLRPAEMQRSSMFAWLQECPHCGYVAGDIEQSQVKVSLDFLKSDEYLTCEGHDFKSDLAKRFYRHHLISKANNIHDSEFFSLLHCAWVCDDNDDDLAVGIRKLALKSIDKVDAKNDDEMDNLKIIKADLLRRSLQFDELVEEFKDVFFEDKIKNEIINFQLELAVKKDSACYSIEDVPTKVTVTLNGELHKKLNLIANLKRVSLADVIEEMLSEKADETDMDELMKNYYSNL